MDDGDPDYPLSATQQDSLDEETSEESSSSYVTSQPNSPLTYSTTSFSSSGDSLGWATDEEVPWPQVPKYKLPYEPIPISLETIALACENLPEGNALLRMFIDIFALDWNPSKVPAEDEPFLRSIPSEFWIAALQAGFYRRHSACPTKVREVDPYWEIERLNSGDISQGPLESDSDDESVANNAEDDHAPAPSRTETSGTTLTKALEQLSIEAGSNSTHALSC